MSEAIPKHSLWRRRFDRHTDKRVLNIIEPHSTFHGDDYVDVRLIEDQVGRMVTPGQMRGSADLGGVWSMSQKDLLEDWILEEGP